MTKICQADQSAIEEAAAIIKAGGLVAMPTETVYGLAGNALDGQAVARIYAAKGRPSFNPLIAHFADAKDAEDFALFDDRARALAQSFWPGPLTMILPKIQDCGVSELATAGLETIALRVPDHQVARDLIRAAGVPLVAPSANKSGALSPTAPAHVAASLGDKVDMILAAGKCRVGLESTVVDLTGPQAVILRPGAILAEDLEGVLGAPVMCADDSDDSDIKSPGRLLKHYAPDTPVRLNAVDVKTGEALLAFGSIKFMGVERREAGGGAAKDLPETALRNLSEEGDLYEAAANLFAMLKDLDRPEHSAIAVMNIPERGLGIAINDRLKRAAQRA
jgi:L-threonylcarbamoyladenylate synthase